MRKQNHSEVDFLIKETLEEIANSSSPPPVDAGLRDLKRRINQKRHGSLNHFYKGLKFRLAAGVVLTIIAASIFMPKPAGAFSEKIFNFIERAIGGTVNSISTLFIKEHKNAPEVPDVMIKEIPVGQKQTVSIETAKERAAFLRLPQYILDGFTLNEVLLQDDNEGNVALVVLVYNNSSGDSLRIMQEKACDTYSSSTSYDTDDGNATTVVISGYEGVLIDLKHNRSELTWFNYENGIVYTIQGEISKEDILKTASSMCENR